MENYGYYILKAYSSVFFVYLNYFLMFTSFNISYLQIFSSLLFWYELAFRDLTITDILSFFNFVLLSIAVVYIPLFSLCSWFCYPFSQNLEFRNLMIPLLLYSVCTVCVKFFMSVFLSYIPLYQMLFSLSFISLLLAVYFHLFFSLKLTRLFI